MYIKFKKRRENLQLFSASCVEVRRVLCTTQHFCLRLRFSTSNCPKKMQKKEENILKIKPFLIMKSIKLYF